MVSFNFLSLIGALSAQTEHCNRALLSNKITAYLHDNHIADIKLDDIIAVRDSKSPLICVLTYQYGYTEKHEQTVYIAADGSYVFPRAVDLNTNANDNFIRNVKLDGYPIDGSPSAPVKIVVFSDFQCPFCKTFGIDIRSNIKKTFGNKVAFIFKWYSLKFHDWAPVAADYTACIYTQKHNEFWHIHDVLYDNQEIISRDNLDALMLNFAAQNHIDIATLDKCRKEINNSNGIIEMAKREASGLRVDGTPTVYVNGRKSTRPTDLSQISNMVKDELVKLNDVK
jgi:protein-disulfide isomerase